MTPAVVAQIEGYVRQEWSPEQIAGRLETTGGLRRSPERMYQHIRADQEAGGTLYRPLRHRQKKRKKRYGKPDARGQIKDRISIDQRPAIVDQKSRIGDWVIDLVMGAKGQGALVSLVEWRSRYTLLGKVTSKQAEEVADTTVELLTPHKAHTARRLPPTTARSSHNTKRSPLNSTWISTSRIRMLPGSAVPTKT